MTNNQSNGYSLSDLIHSVDPIQGRRFDKLKGNTLEIATEGIIRHMRACIKNEIKPDSTAIREIIDDAINGRRVYAESDDDTADVSRTQYYFSSITANHSLDN